MKTTRTLGVYLLFLVTLLFSSAGVARAANEWDPKKTWVFFVCLVKWQDKETFVSFPEKIRKDGIFLDSLRKRGVPEDHIVYYKDSEATTARVEAAFPAFLRRAAADDWVIVYFEGHGYKNDAGVPYLATYDVSDTVPGWKFDAVPNAIERNFRGSRAIIALDNCYSGAMASAVKSTKRRVSYAVLASSLASQTSTGNWTFTEAMLAGFNGEAYVDENHDGKITLAELGDNASRDMLFGEEQMATIVFTGDLDPQTVIATAATPSSSRVGERVEAYSVDGWYKGFIADKKNEKYKIHYYGYEQSDDEWVTSNLIRTAQLVRFAVGERVEVEWQKKWYPARIVEVKGGSHFITYEDFGHEWDEWVSSKRIRRIK